MNQEFQIKKPTGDKRQLLIIVILLSLVTLLVLSLALVILFKSSTQQRPSETAETADQTAASTAPSLPVVGQTEPMQTEPLQTEPPITYQDVTLLSAGDIMFHYPNLRTSYNAANDSYDFTDIFQYLPSVIGRYDYAVANLETTISGKDKGYTQQNSISFNAPDSALDAIKSAGFDMMLFANNHTYDRGIDGVKRTVSFLEENGMDCIGATNDKEKKAYQIVDIGGVKVGMLNYTNDGSFSTYASGSINGIPLKQDHAEYINLFYLNDLASFYERVRQEMAELREKGADLIVFYIHWGLEYQSTPHKKQTEIAQTLCDMGVDAIIGSHPHVIQPMETLTSTTDPAHKTVCFYSLGNFISNQNRNSLPNIEGSERTENGLMVVLTIRKYSTGQTLIVGIETIPTWVHRYRGPDYINDHRIIPLQDALKNPEAFGLTDSSYGVTHATEALAMTKNLIDDAVSAFNQSITLPTGTENAIPTPAERKENL